MRATTLLGFVLMAMAASPAVANAQDQVQATNAAAVTAPAVRQLSFTWATPSKIRDEMTSTTVSAATETSFDYGTNEGTVAIGHYMGSGGVVNIPNTIDGLPVVSIGVSAFADCDRLTSASIPSNVIRIQDWAFAGCIGLTNVTIGSSVRCVGDCAFLACTSLTSVTIPSSVTSIGERAFANCRNLKGVYFKGDAPSPSAFVFDHASTATVYYLEGTKGWGPTFGGRPTAVWKPEGGAATSGVPFSGAQR